MYPMQQLWHRREWSHQRQIFRFKQFAAPFLHFLTVVLLLGLGQEHRDQLITALADLATRLFEGHIVAEPGQCLLPRARVQIDGIHQGAVDVENGSLGHSRSEELYRQQRSSRQMVA